MIDYSKIAKAQEYYNKLGYKYIEVPWLVSKQANEVTKPQGIKDYETFNGCLVASGEQSFIQLILNNKLNYGLYSCITPCYRNEKEYNEYTYEYFLKLELIYYFNHIGDEIDNQILKMLYDAKRFFSNYICWDKLNIVNTNIGYDINGVLNDKEIELGSYGYRKWNSYKWIYGTGIAEPRFSLVYDKIINREQNGR